MPVTINRGGGNRSCLLKAVVVNRILLLTVELNLSFLLMRSGGADRSCISTRSGGANRSCLLIRIGGAKPTLSIYSGGAAEAPY